MTTGQTSRKPRLLMVINSASFFLSHRLPVALAAVVDGFDVHVATADVTGVDCVNQTGITHHVIPLSRSGQNPLSELRTLFALYRLFRLLRPDVLHLVTVKPVLYGGLAARLARVPGMVAAISGLGFVFTGQGLRARLTLGVVSNLYRWALGHPNLRIIVQNKNDQQTLQQLTRLDAVCFRLVPGSGVDLQRYAWRPESAGEPLVILASRMLFDKGIGEFVEAARRLKRKGVQARFVLAGSSDPGNPASASDVVLKKWNQEGCVEWWGYCSDMAEIFARSHLVVLPSYYGEGLPKVLIEAAACGRAVVTTDSPGCRDAIEPNVTGLLVPVRDIPALTDAIESLIKDTERRRAMGVAARRRAEEIFPLEKVTEAHLAIYRELLQG